LLHLITQKDTVTFDRAYQDEGSACCRSLTQQSRNKHVPAAGFEPATPESKRPQTYASDIAATGIG